ncbi:MAG: hypothetical protein JO306_06840 [Gemmatimonadetes bacterium]|nr:hypothetical protein [Gemmatimonadota bacterium]
MPNRTRETPAASQADPEGCPTLVLPTAAAVAAGGRVSVRVQEGEEIAGLREWVRRYVAAVVEADAAARARGGSGGEEDGGP